MIDCTPVYHGPGQDEPVGYYIAFPLRVTVYVGKRWGSWWPPHVSVFLRHKEP